MIFCCSIWFTSTVTPASCHHCWMSWAVRRSVASVVVEYLTVGLPFSAV